MKKTFRHNQFTATFEDENGYFSFTGHIDGGGGACGDEIASIYPDFQLLEDMHLASSATGEPMHGLSNALYHFKEAGCDIAKLEEYWHVKLTDERKERIRKAVADVVQRTAVLRQYIDTHHSQVHMPGAVSFGEMRFLTAKDREAYLEQQIINEWTVVQNVVATVMDQIRPIWKLRVQEVYDLVEDTDSDLTEPEDDFNADEEFEEPAKARALADFLGCDVSIVEEDDDGETYAVSGEDYQVLTDDEADDAWDKELDNYLEECVLPEVPENIRRYFDEDRWKDDAKGDGRGHSLSRYDGDEHEIIDPVTEEVFYAYRQ